MEEQARTGYLVLEMALAGEGWRWDGVHIRGCMVFPVPDLCLTVRPDIHALAQKPQQVFSRT